MGVIRRSVEFTASAGGTGIQRVTMPVGFTLQPKGYRLVIFRTTTDGTFTQTAGWSEGWSDGTNNWCQAGRAQSSAGNSNCDSYLRTDDDRVGAVFDNSAQSLDDYCDHSAFGVASERGYVEIKWNGGAAPNSAWRCVLTAWAGTDLTMEVGNFTTSGIVGNPQTITVGTGLTAHALRILGCQASVSAGDNYASLLRFGGGWGVSDGAATPTIQQYAHGWHLETGQANPWPGQIMESSEHPTAASDRIYAQGDSTTSGSGLLELELADVDSGSFKVTPRGTFQTKVICYVLFDVDEAIDLGISWHAQDGVLETGYDDTIQYTSVFSGSTFKPQGIDWAASDMADEGYNRGNLTSGVHPYCFSDEDSLSGFNGGWSWEARENNAYSWTIYHSDEFIQVDYEAVTSGDDPRTRWTADVSTYEADGIDLTYGTLGDSTTKVCCSIAWGEDVAATSPISATLSGAASIGAADLSVAPAPVTATLSGAGAIGAAALSVVPAPVSAVLVGAAAVGAADLTGGPAALTAALAGTAAVGAAALSVGPAALSATLQGAAAIGAALLSVVPAPLTATLVASAAIGAADLTDSSLIVSPIQATLVGSSSVGAADLTGGPALVSATLVASAAIGAADLLGGPVPVSATLAGSAAVGAADLAGGPAALSAALAGTAAIGSADLSAGPAALTATLQGAAAIGAAALVVVPAPVSATLVGSAAIPTASLTDSALAVSAITATLVGSSSIGAADLSVAPAPVSATLAGTSSVGEATLVVVPAPVSATLVGSAAISNASLTDSALAVSPIFATLVGSSSIGGADLSAGPAALTATLVGDSAVGSANLEHGRRRMMFIT